MILAEIANREESVEFLYAEGGVAWLQAESMSLDVPQSYEQNGRMFIITEQSEMFLRRQEDGLVLIVRNDEVVLALETTTTEHGQEIKDFYLFNVVKTPIAH